MSVLTKWYSLFPRIGNLNVLEITGGFSYYGVSHRNNWVKFTIYKHIQ